MACNVVSIAAFLLLIHVPYYVYVYAYYKPYVVCGAPSSCANLGNITYPFWTSFRPDYCGHPAFRLKCGGDFAEITIASRSYKVLGIDQVTNVLTIARTDYWNNGLCTADRANTTLDPAFFYYTWDTRMACLYYNCQGLSSDSYLRDSEKLDCSLDGNFTYYFSRHYADAYLSAACEESVVIPFLKDRLANGKMDSVGAVRSGFSLIWKANKKFCYDCRRSGGQCGYDTTSGDFACHCRDESHPIACRSNGGKLPYDEHYLNCDGSFECGSLGTVGYPFWESRWPHYCGHPDFKLYCTGNAKTITIVSETYQVLEINQATHALRVWKSNIGAYACQAGHNSSILLGSTFFEHTENNEDLVIYYDCPPSITSNLTDTAYICNVYAGDGTLVSNVNFFLTETLRKQYKARGISLTTFAATCNESVVFRTSKSASRVLQNYVSEFKSSREKIVKIDEAISSGIWLGWKEARNGERCDDCEVSGGVCGYDSNSDEFRCNCRDQPYPSTCGSSSGLSATKLSMIIGISAGLFVIIVTSTVTIYLFSKKAVRWKAKNDEFDVEGFMRNYGSFAPKRYFYSNVKKMSKSFAEKIGKGGYGAVYKGKLADGTLVAVKVLKESKRNGEEFINEVASIGRTSHVNVVTLLGFCYESNKRALIYEYLPNGSLDKFIFNQDSLSIDSRLGWKTLYDITMGIARGLEYLHRGCATRILHFDIKPHNILLDNDFCPKISDFGLAKLCQREDSAVSMKGARGTAGYIAPEMYCRNFGRVSYKSDVYSYGMMVLEMVGGRKNIDVGVSRTSEIYFPYWIHNQFEMGDKLDLGGAISNEDEEIARKMILVSLWCIQTIPLDRPSMSKVVEMLEGSVQSIEIPPKPTLSFAGH